MGILKSQLGYGCSSLMGRISERESLRILECAYDHGIRHFDVARSYGYGQAERALGKFLQNRRESVTVTTKAGFAPPRANLMFSAARGVARIVASLAPKLKPLFRRGAAGMVKRVATTPEFLRVSLETSLRELGVDRVEILLLHGCQAEELANPELLEFLESAVRAGRVGRFGIGTDLKNIPDLITQRSEFLQVLQFENNPLVRSMERLDLPHGTLPITHRAIGTAGVSFLRLLGLNPSLEKACSDEISLDLSNSTLVSNLFLAYSMEQNPSGAVLFSTLNPEHLASNARLMSGSRPYSMVQFRLLEEMVNRVIA